MSVYMELFNAMDGNLRMSKRHELLKQYAHELAEWIREVCHNEYDPGEPGVCPLNGLQAANLIDPEIPDV